jgi:hypothetical protein
MPFHQDVSRSAEFIAVPRTQGQFRALAAELLGERKSQAPRPAGDHDDFVPEAR